MRRRRDELDLSLREFAKRLNCSAAFISDIELGRRYPSEKVLGEIARVLDVKLEELEAMDVRAPIEDIKRLTQNDPRFALAFRTMIDKKVSADELLNLANQKRIGEASRSQRNENLPLQVRTVLQATSFSTKRDRSDLRRGTAEGGALSGFP